MLVRMGQEHTTDKVPMDIITLEVPRPPIRHLAELSVVDSLGVCSLNVDSRV